ncbi:PAS domain S-box-containing protein/diguanylate cyclase (GGDEF) domain-containing protein [Colwellia chukchiensis]|uniref:PAS domain S-box-containing protein/diguanylate cyclase (GGDEF) domain-containing protein n=1 Tax=Colwellia chukchiensis TaxID=641665 RepID=A0A1H7NZ91_9GAMM|nr:diguanylate cyclase [Colwellia chukchiensis]SEL28177.1 PAS domain S-box-containing protein/diguanylate cyclase (GGDEF) domain-containing protein [Colwellia chukchiensis]
MKENSPNDAIAALSTSLNDSAISSFFLQEIFNGFEEAVIVTDVNRCVVYINAATEQLFGYSKDELYHQQTKILYADENDFSEQGRKRFNVASRISEENYRIVYRHAKGQQFLGMTTGAAIRNAAGETVGFIGIIRPARSADQSLDALQKIHNITADVNLSHEQKINALLRVGLQHFGLKIAILSQIEGNEYTVENCVDLNGELEPATTFDVTDTYCLHTLSENRTLGFNYVAKSEIKDHPCYEKFALEAYIGSPIRLAGKLYGTINFSSALPVEPFSKDDYILMELLSDTCSFLLYQKVSQAEMTALARVDELTGLPNRRATLERLTELIAQSRRFEQPLSILSIDIDHFKRINDRWGHAAGDLALVKFASVASTLGRQTDFCGRLGGEEFVFVQPGANIACAQALGDKLRDCLALAPIDVGDGELNTLTVSVGIAMLAGDETAESILAHADQAMYRAKQQGRDRVSQ